ncbi:Lipoma HMGIC fusion partner like protein [Trachymyrmex zeteki]|uniref:Lipoma HMGIC fusion partner like protein n=1 Tax=Mycetomoellerius zeteki TaxID=64791 RepID=A0A151WNP8_9HYME|nr:Lipoma HMGIC fusion partner like protein [Trachymyrmex zeteki]
MNARFRDQFRTAIEVREIGNPSGNDVSEKKDTKKGKTERRGKETRRMSGQYLEVLIVTSIFDSSHNSFFFFPTPPPPSSSTLSLSVLLFFVDEANIVGFWDIPSVWWQASTVTMGIGVAIAVIGALTLLAAASSFLPHILKTPKHTRILGSLQLLAATMICGGLVMYPIGWDNREVRESCGKGANVYNLGKCSVSWSSHLLVGSVALLMLCFGLSFCAARHKPDANPHTDPLRI